MAEVLNIPLKLIQRLSKEKRLEELSCAVMLKRKHRNSIIYDLTLKSIEDVFNVCHATAVKLKEKLIGSDLFIYNEKNNTLFAKPFKSKDGRTYGNGKWQFKSSADYCLKFDTDTSDLRLRDVTVILRKHLIIRAIDAPAQKQSLQKHLSFLNCDEQEPEPEPTTLSMYAGIISMSKSTAGRYINRMVEERKVSKSEIVAELVIPHYTAERLHDYQVAHPHQYLFVAYSSEFHNWWCWVNKGRRYSLTDIRLRDCFRNVIYEHPGRKKALAKKTIDEQCTFDGRPDFFYDNIKKHRIL